MEEMSIISNVAFPVIILMFLIWIFTSFVPKVKTDHRTAERRTYQRRKRDRRTEECRFCLFDRRVAGNILENRRAVLNRRVADRRASTQ